MRVTQDWLVASATNGLLPLYDLHEPLRVMIASLALGGAERIVLDWLAAEAARGRLVELAVLHARRLARPVPGNVVMHTRGGRSIELFVREMSERWKYADAPVSTHLVADDVLAMLWNGGVRTVPVVHNAKAGWRNDPACWKTQHVPLAVACSEAVRDEMLIHGCGVPVHVVRHQPSVGAQAFDLHCRVALRRELGVGPDTLLVAVAGAFKPQKDHGRAVDVLQYLCLRRDAALMILGGALDSIGLTELDRTVDAAIRAGVADRLKLPGFVQPIEPYYAACDVLLNVSQFEGYSMAVQEALAAGIPVVATDVGGQREAAHPKLHLLPLESSNESIAHTLAEFTVRTSFNATSDQRAEAAHRLWSLTTAWRQLSVASNEKPVETLFVTANLNAGGAQRSLINLVTQIAPMHSLAVAVCGGATHPAFPAMLKVGGVRFFRPAADNDAFANSEALIAFACAQGVSRICLWNVDPKMKLLLARFSPTSIALIDVSPGHYAFEEIESATPFAHAIGTSVGAYYQRLDLLVLKYQAASHPPCKRIAVIPNGVATREVRAQSPTHPCFLVSGRVAPSKRLEIILDAFRAVHAECPQAELHVVGQAEPRYAEYAATLAANAADLSVRFRGAMPELRFLEEPFTAAIVLGTHQGCPNAALEAMSAGVPVIANDSGGTRDLVLPDCTGWLLPENVSSGALAEAMLDAARDGERACRLGLNAQHFVREHHTLEAMARDYLRLFTPSQSKGACAHHSPHV